jgi:hypothetical protein
VTDDQVGPLGSGERLVVTAADQDRRAGAVDESEDSRGGDTRTTFRLMPTSLSRWEWTIGFDHQVANATCGFRQEPVWLRVAAVSM